MALPSRGDFGIILYKTGLPLGIAYTDITDTAQSVTELTGAYTGHTVTAVGGRSTSEPFVGAKDALSLFVTIALAGATDIRIKVQGRYKTAEPWLFRSDRAAPLVCCPDCIVSYAQGRTRWRR